LANKRNGPVEDEDLTEDTLKGAKVYGEDGVLLAEVTSLQGRGPYAHVILQTEGFLGFGSKLVSLPMRSFAFVHEDEGMIEARTTWNLDDLKKAPAEPSADETLRPVGLPEPL
jgi:PRC-barrel domain